MLTIRLSNGLLLCETQRSDGAYSCWAVVSPKDIDLKRFSRIEIKKANGTAVAVLTGDRLTYEDLEAGIKAACSRGSSRSP